MPLIISHPETNPEIRKIEDEIAAKKEILAQLITKEKSTIITDYTFLNAKNNLILLSELFKGKDELIIVFYMGIQCKYCTLWGDNYNGISAPLSNRAAFAVVSNETPKEQNKIKKNRDWNFEMYSRSKNTFAEDLGFIGEEGNPLPGIASFLKKGNEIFVHHRSYFGPGDNYCNMWDFVSILPKGINNWKPKYIY
jgi:predicted dithiol-disulfide oxidoreductase (DUF899 family)